MRKGLSESARAPKRKVNFVFSFEEDARAETTSVEGLAGFRNWLSSEAFAVISS